MALLDDVRAWAEQGFSVAPQLARRLDEVDCLLTSVEDPHRTRTHADWSDGVRFADTPYGRALVSADDPTLRAAALWGHRLVCLSANGYLVWPAMQLASALARRKLAWTAEEVTFALRLAVFPGGHHYGLAMRATLPIGAAERLPRSAVTDVSDLVFLLRSQIGLAPQLLAAERERLGRRLGAVLDGPPGSLGAFPPSLLHDGDDFGPDLRRELAPLLDSPGVPALFVHASKAAGPRPPAKWRAEGARLLAAAPDGPRALREVLERATRHREQPRIWEATGSEYLVWVHESTGRLLRGLLLLASGLGEPWVTSLLGELLLVSGGGFKGNASTPRELVVANAALSALADREGAVPYLARAQARLKYGPLLRAVTTALEAAAERTGTPLSELLETTVPDYGLAADGRRTEQLGSYTAVLAVHPPAKVAVSFATEDGRTLAGAPAAVRSQFAAELAALRAEAKEIRTTLAAERVRIESLMAEERTWTFDAWARAYRDHPVVGRLVRGLLWQVQDGGSWRTVLLTGEGELTALDGSAVQDGGPVRLWHPLLSDSGEVGAWRERLMASELRQPFKQAFREIYRLTPAEVTTHDHSNRFAAHVLRAPQAQALMRTRGWTGAALGYWDSGFEGHVTKTFVGGWRAEFFFDLIQNEADGYGTPGLASSDQVRFSRPDGDGWQARPLSEVPPLILTEAMRDVDLFVGVTSIAADPAWVTRGARDHETYWHRTSFGELGESARNRREALERLVPRLRIADRCTLTERFLEVRGELRTYRIHLGSGNILMAPDDEYLCIVPSRAERGPTVYLPFEEDGGMLSVILSKAFLLAGDSRITDADIIRQITRR